MNVIITDHGFPGVVEEQRIISEAGGTLEVVQCKTAEQVIASCRNADALLVQWAPITADVIATLERCKVIVRYGIGVDNVDLEAAAARGIAVCNIPDYCLDEVAEHSLALALALARQLPQIDATVRNGTWKITPPRPFPALREVTFVTAGYGRIARAVLERAKPFGFRLAAYDPFVDPAVFAAHGVRRLNRDELFREAGILSLHLPLTVETRHFVGAEELSVMRPEAIVVNTARGGLIDTVSLAEALTAGRLHGAGIDVFEPNRFLSITRSASHRTSSLLPTLPGTAAAASPSCNARPHRKPCAANNRSTWSTASSWESKLLWQNIFATIVMDSRFISYARRR